MNDLERNRQRGELLREFIGLRYAPVALKFLGDGEKIPDKARKSVRLLYERKNFD